VEGYTLEELAVSLELPIGTLKSRLHRGRAHLRTLLMEPSGAGERVRQQRIAS
jgi:DNA-directed RNA polymerase specialized sigma24 family protein